jgi:hypothetical protein
MFPWKEPNERIPMAVRQIHSFLKAHHPARIPRIPFYQDLDAGSLRQDQEKRTIRKT